VSKACQRCEPFALNHSDPAIADKDDGGMKKIEKKLMTIIIMHRINALMTFTLILWLFIRKINVWASAGSRRFPRD